MISKKKILQLMFSKSGCALYSVGGRRRRRRQL